MRLKEELIMPENKSAIQECKEKKIFDTAWIYITASYYEYFRKHRDLDDIIKEVLNKTKRDLSSEKFDSTEDIDNLIINLCKKYFRQ